uniref:Gamma-tubulin complex component n=1 Tax=Leersia perrieri TaxID=77586 RepID=A0A0D9VV26_9ORYZ
MSDAGTQPDCDGSSSSGSEEAQNPAPANGKESSPHSRQQDSRWLRTLSEPELDLLISLKDLAMAYTANASLSVLGHDYDLRTLRALGIVLLENLKERLKGTSVDPSIFNRLALLSDSDAHFPSIASDAESEEVRSKSKRTPTGVNGKRKQMQAGRLNEEHKKRRKLASQDSNEHR